MATPNEHEIKQAALALQRADALIIGAGAGMGVDSGLPDFRGREGFWQAYPPFAKLGLEFTEIANPRWFARDPTLAWGFYGHRLELYRKAEPHAGFAILRRWGARMPGGSFVFTSNVDGQFQRAGFHAERIVEVHGSIHWLQCRDGCGVGPFSADRHSLSIDESTMRACEPLPDCPSCGGPARPNVLMFGDWDWDGDRSRAQEARFQEWLRTVAGGRLVVVECGAGTAVPTIRLGCERLARSSGGTLIRINPREPRVPSGHVSLPMGALDALRAIDELIARGGACQ
jgi:NAD-dependent SIR2 family protein deacetylase